MVPYDDAAASSYGEDDLPPWDLPGDPEALPPREAGFAASPGPAGPAAPAPGVAAEGESGASVSKGEFQSLMLDVFGSGVVFKAGQDGSDAD